jgi:amidase
VPNTGAYNQPGGFTDLRTQIGPLARHVDDLMLVLRIIDGPDYADAGVIPMPLYDPAALAVKDLTVAFFPYDPDSLVTAEIADAVGAAAQALARAGMQMVENRPLDLVGGSRDLDRGWRNMAATRGQDVVELHAAWDRFRTNMLQFMVHYDAIVCPADHHPAPPFAERDAQRFDYTVPFSLAGYPSAVVRTGASQNGLPIGVQVVSHPWREDIVLALAGILEQAFGGWQPPSL